MRNSCCVALVIALVLYGVMTVQAVPHGIGTVTLADGTETSCEVLFEHSHAPRPTFPAKPVSTVRSTVTSTSRGIIVSEEAWRRWRNVSFAEKQPWRT